MMGEISGTQLASILKKRESTAGIPIIFCTARDDEEDMVSGLDLGADDYITKPYSIRNVLARVRSVLRRSVDNVQPARETIGHEDLRISLRQKTCFIGETEIRMPRKEFEILSLLLSNRGRVFSREELLKKVWRDEAVVLDRVVDVNITRLRSKLGDYGRLIVTRPGYGYGFME